MSTTIESFAHVLRRTIVYPLLRLVFRNSVSTSSIDLQNVQRLLLFRYDRIGDMIITTPILRILKQQNPSLRLDVLASRANAEIIQENRFVDHVVVLETNWFRLFRQVLDLRRQNYDVLLNFIFNRTTGPAILANLIAPHGQKVGQGPDRYAFYFNRLVKLRRYDQHMLLSYLEMVEQTFGTRIDPDELRYELSVDKDSKLIVDHWLTTTSLRRKAEDQGDSVWYVVLNPAGKDPERSIGVQHAAALIKDLSGEQSFQLVVLESPDNKAMIRAFREKQVLKNCLVYRTLGPKPLAELASLIEGAIAVITPDTSIVHFASAMQTAVLALYNEQKASVEWLPWNVLCEEVHLERDGTINDLEPKLLLEKTRNFISKALKARPSTARGNK